ncbi:NAD(P)-binding protein [Gymnopus androsaceus JB14]|uniref:D-arabinitol 2-dehydrogenase [ribulose-forming] n=1 Tax=Gymnopus androsaceus JB14 TaxID=1447944 RepID=A0A6A4HJF6_9AGAR|nr:NAD(P)-binding protein [Gymnopus androsaceus JB14]
MASNESRNELTKRIIPQMTLSDASNPLTAPLKMAENLTANERVQMRFAIEGNAIVTGGAGTIGLSSIRALLEHGASGIAIFDVPSTFTSSQSAIDTLKKDFPQVAIRLYDVDVRDDVQVNDRVQRVVNDFGSVSLLLCFAGVVGSVHAHEMKFEEWKRVLDVNLTGSWLCAQAVGKQMIAQKSGGCILFTCSISAHRVNFPQPQVAYNTSKAGVLHLARSLAAEWSPHGIRVNSLSPGYMDTILNEGDGLTACREIWTSRNPMGRMGDVEELNGAVVLLCSKRAGRYITGIDIVVDGGGTVF